MRLIHMSFCFRMHMHSVVCWLQLDCEAGNAKPIWDLIKTLEWNRRSRWTPKCPEPLSFQNTPCCSDTVCVCVCVCVHVRTSHIWLFVCSTLNHALLMEWWKGSRLSALTCCPLLPCSVITLFNWLEVECPDLILSSD